MANELRQRSARGLAHDAGVPFGLRDSRMYAAMDVPRGLACHCLCPGCGAPLVAKHGAGRRQPHFAHYGSVPNESCAETAVHLYAKQILTRASRLNLPRWTGAEGMPNPPEATDAAGLLHLGESVHWPARVTHIWDAQSELPRAGIRPDVVMEDSDGELLVEVLVTHAVDDAKALTVRRLDARMLEIDLSSTKDSVVADPAAFKRWVLEGAPRKWIWLPGAARLWRASRDRLVSELEEEARRKEKRWRSGYIPTPDPIDWAYCRAQVEARELKPISASPALRDPLVGATIRLPRLGQVKVLDRLTRSSMIYRIRLADGSERNIFMGYST